MLELLNVFLQSHQWLDFFWEELFLQDTGGFHINLVVSISAYEINTIMKVIEVLGLLEKLISELCGQQYVCVVKVFLIMSCVRDVIQNSELRTPSAFKIAFYVADDYTYFGSYFTFSLKCF